jgi:hypothetical protein
MALPLKSFFKPQKIFTLINIKLRERLDKSNHGFQQPLNLSEFHHKPLGVGTQYISGWLKPKKNLGRKGSMLSSQKVTERSNIKINLRRYSRSPTCL